MGTGRTWLVVAGCAGVVVSITALGCGGGPAHTGTNPSEVPSQGGASGAPGPAPGTSAVATSGGATSNVVGSGGATGNVGGATGNVGGATGNVGAATGNVGSGGAAGGGGASGTAGAFSGGTGGASGGASSGGAAGTGAGGAGAFANLHVYGNTTTLELAPVLLAAQSIYPAKATVTNGGIPNLFSAGQADIATNAETQALRQSVAHPDLRIVFTVCEGFYRIVARKSAGIATLSDLRGKRIGTTPSTSSAFYLHKMLATVQLTESDVTVVAEALPSQMPSALSSHAVDAVTIWEPEIQNAADALGTDAIEFQDRSVYRELFNLNTTSEKLGNATTRRSIVEFVKSLVTASAQIRSQPSSVWPLVATTTGYDAALIAKAWDNEGFAGTLVSDLLDVLTDEETWVAKSDGRAARSRSDLAPLIDDSVLKDALASP